MSSVKKKYHTMTSYPDMEDSDEDGYEDHTDLNPLLKASDEERKIIDFCATADYFEIEYAYELWNQATYYNFCKINTFSKAVDAIELCRRFENSFDIDEMQNAFYDYNLVEYNSENMPSYQKIWMKISGGSLFYESTIIIQDYKLHKESISLYEIADNCYKQWYQSAQMAACIWLFGFCDSISPYDSNGNIKFDRRWFKTDGSFIWPENGGFNGKPYEYTLEKGDIITRYGSENGRYASPRDVSFNQRSLAPGTELSKMYTYEVVKPITVQAGIAAPFFGAEGGGVQYLFDNSMYWYVKNGYLIRS